MVKNTSGGTRTKGLARKHVNAAAGGGGGSKLRLPEDPLEVMVYVSALLGNGMCEVYNNDGLRFIAHIRNKFKGRHKRSNLITKNSIILCGYREWENPYKNLDVIFIYDDNNIKALRNVPTISIQSILLRIDSANIQLHTNTLTYDTNTLTNDIFQDDDDIHQHDHDHDHKHKHKHNTHIIDNLLLHHEFDDI